MGLGALTPTAADGYDIPATRAIRFSWSAGNPLRILIHVSPKAPAGLEGRINVTTWDDPDYGSHFTVLPGQTLPLPFVGNAGDGKSIQISSLMLGSTDAMEYGKDFTVDGFFA